MQFKTLYACIGIVNFYHMWANIDADELGNIQSKHMWDLAYITKIAIKISYHKHHADVKWGGKETFALFITGSRLHLVMETKR